MIKKTNFPPITNAHTNKELLKESFLFAMAATLDECDELIEAEERIMLQIMQDIIKDQGSYDFGKRYIEKMLLKVKHLSK